MRIKTTGNGTGAPLEVLSGGQSLPLNGPFPMWMHTYTPGCTSKEFAPSDTILLGTQEALVYACTLEMVTTQ